MSWRRRLTLRRQDGRVYLNRWGIGSKRFGSIMLHRMDAPDPGLDLHDHPWTFVSIVLAGAYIEERAPAREAPVYAAMNEQYPSAHPRRGTPQIRLRWSVRRLRLDEAHRVTEIYGRACWTLVLCGPVRRSWGFYLASGYLDEKRYDDEIRIHRRDLIEDNGYLAHRLDT